MMDPDDMHNALIEQDARIESLEKIIESLINAMGQQNAAIAALTGLKNEAEETNKPQIVIPH